MKTYVRIMQDIQKKIEEGVYKQHEQLPALRELAKIYNTTPVTAKKSLSLLEEKGYIYVINRKGFFINVPDYREYEMIFHEIKSISEQTDIKVTGVQTIDPEIVEKRFSVKLRENAKCLVIERKIFNKLLPIGLDYKYLIFAGKISHSFENLHFLQSRIDMVISNYDTRKFLSIGVLSDTKNVRDTFLLSEHDPVYDIKIRYETMPGQLIGFSETYVPCEEMQLRMQYM